MFGAFTHNFNLGKYTASSRPVDPVSDWSENFKKIADQMWSTESLGAGINNSIAQYLDEVEEQHTIIDGVNNRVATTATKVSQINIELGNTRVTVNQALTISSGASELASQALSNAQMAQTEANSALSLNTAQISQISDLRVRILNLENQQKGDN